MAALARGVCFRLLGRAPRHESHRRHARRIGRRPTPRDDDPELVGAALPFSLKLMESVLAETPEHRGASRSDRGCIHRSTRMPSCSRKATHLRSTTPIAPGRTGTARAGSTCARATTAFVDSTSRTRASARGCAPITRRPSDVQAGRKSTSSTGPPFPGLARLRLARTIRRWSRISRSCRRSSIARWRSTKAGTAARFTHSSSATRWPVRTRPGDRIANARAHFDRAVALSEGQGGGTARVPGPNRSACRRRTAPASRRPSPPRSGLILTTIRRRGLPTRSCSGARPGSPPISIDWILPPLDEAAGNGEPAP